MENKVTDVNRATWDYLSLHPTYYVVAALIFVASCILIFFSHAIQFLIIPLIAVFVIYAIVSNKMRGDMMKQFAKSLGYEYTEIGDIKDLKASLFGAGHDREMINVISGKDNGRPVRIFSYSYTIGSGKSSHRYYYTVFENTFSGNMPSIVLHKAGLFSQENPPHFSGGEHISLEGDFNKYFSLSVEKEFEIEAYQIFTPDFMEELIETSKSLGFEFSQNKLYIYAPEFIDERAKLDSMFALSNKLCDHLEPVINKIKSDVDLMKDIMSEHKN